MYTVVDLIGFKNPWHKFHYLYQCLYGIQYRCTAEHDPHYYLYGARGIRIHDEWIGAPTVFALWILNNLGPRPDGLSLDRRDNDGHYEPGNLRWATRSEQNSNRRLPSRDQSGVHPDQNKV